MKITVDTRELDAGVRFLAAMAKDQIPFAMSRTINDLAEEGRAKVVAGLPGKFTLRKLWWKPRSKFGFNVTPSKKTNLVAEIFTKAPWMVSFEHGETRRPIGSAFAVPTKNVRRLKNETISKANRPLALKGSFIANTPRGRVIFQRLKLKGITTIKAMYGLEPKAVISPTLQMGVTIRKVVDQQFNSTFSKRLQEAVATAKKS